MSDNFFANFNEGWKFGENISKLGLFFWECLIFSIVLGVHLHSFAAGLVLFILAPLAIRFLAANERVCFVISCAFSSLWAYVVYSISLECGTAMLWAVLLGIIAFSISMTSHYNAFRPAKNIKKKKVGSASF